MICPKQVILKEQLSHVDINPENATKFYSHMFTVAPDLRSFFKGAENIDPKDVPASERFQKQGQRLITSVHVMVELWPNKMALNGYLKDFADKHRRFKGLELAHYDAFFGVWYGFLEKLLGKGNTPPQHDAWESFKQDFLCTLKPYL